MSKRLHPDKHMSPEHKKEAEILFNKVKKAYDGIVNYQIRCRLTTDQKSRCPILVLVLDIS